MNNTLEGARKPLKIEDIAPNKLHASPWNSNVVDPEGEVKLDASLKRLGFFKPVLVRELQDGSLQIIGGEHRAASAVRLGYASIPVVNLGEVDDKRAKEISLADNGRWGHDDANMLAVLLEEIGSIEDVASFLPYNEGELSSIFQSVDIALDEIGLDSSDDIRPESNDMTPRAQTHQIMRFKVPVEDAATVQAIIDSIMKTQRFTEEDSLTNAGHALVHLCGGV